MAKRKKVEFDFTSVVDGMLVEGLNISFANPNCFHALHPYFQRILQKDSTFGQGILSYTGRSTSNNSVFLGTNPRLQNYSVSFSGAEGINIFEDFRKNFLNLTKNKDLIQDMKICNLVANSIISPESRMFLSDFSQLLEETVNLQQKSLPKVSKDKGILYIGGKTGATCVQIKGLMSADLQVKKISVSLKLKAASGENCFFLTKESIGASFETIVAYFILKQFSRINLSVFLEGIRVDLTKNFVVGTVASYAQKEERATTKHGKYILRSLSGIKNKLIDRDTTLEAQTLLISWLYLLVRNQEFQFQNKTQFLTLLKKISTLPNILLETILKEVNSTLSDSFMREVIEESRRASSPTPHENDRSVDVSLDDT